MQKLNIDLLNIFLILFSQYKLNEDSFKNFDYN